jgi:Zn-dependent protease
MEPLLIFFLLALVFSIIIHEVSHGYIAEFLGDPTARLQGRLTLNPIPHIDMVGTILVPGFLLFLQAGFLFGWAKPVPYNPYNLKNQRWGEAMVAGAGPGVNILIALIFGLVVRFGEGVLPHDFILLAGVIVFINVLLAFFNMLPIPPLDGSKVLRAFLPFRAELAFQRFEGMLMRGGLFLTLLIFFVLITLFGGYFFMLLNALFWVFTGMDLGMLCPVMPWMCG